MEGRLQHFDFKPRGIISLDVPFSVDFSFGVDIMIFPKPGSPFWGSSA